MTKPGEPSTPSGSSETQQRRRQITSYKNTTTSPATDIRACSPAEGGGRICSTARPGQKRSEHGLSWLADRETSRPTFRSCSPRVGSDRSLEIAVGDRSVD